MESTPTSSLLDIPAMLQGDRLSLTRVLTHVENESPHGKKALEEIFAYTGTAKTIGVTGAPGAGKSSLVNRLALEMRAQFPDKKIAIIAVDPTSPFSGGAMLGDRVRMRALSGDKNIFIRSMASRGALGGLAWTTENMIQVFDAAGFDFVIIETVGAGQSEVDVCRIAETTLVIEVPGLGDDIQALKAGILETADILVVNKADKRGADATVQTLKNMLTLSPPKQSGWDTPVCKMNSISGEGAEALVNYISTHTAFSETDGNNKNKAISRIERHLRLMLQEALFTEWQNSLEGTSFEEMVQAVYDKKENPYQFIKDAIKTETKK